MLEEKSISTETSEIEEDWAPPETALSDLGVSDETDTGIETEETAETEETETKSPETKEAETSKDEVETLDETKLLEEEGLESFTDKGGIRAVLKAYKGGLKTFTQSRQFESELDELAKEQGIAGPSAREKLLGIIQKTIQEQQKAQIDPDEERLNTFNQEIPELNWDLKTLKAVRKALGLNEFEQYLGTAGMLLTDMSPLMFRDDYEKLEAEYSEKGAKLLAPVSDLIQIAKENPELIRRARSKGENRLKGAYRIWLAENKGEDLLDLTYKAGEKAAMKKTEEKKNLRTTEKPGGKPETLPLDLTNLTPQKAANLPLEQLRKIVKTPEFEKNRRKLFNIS